MFDGLPLSCLSATMVLAYCQYYTCKYVLGRSFTNTDLRTLISWLGCPTSAPPRSLRQHLGLAAHITLLQAAGLLTHNDAIWHLTPEAMSWLQLTHERQSKHLLQAIEDCRFRTAIEKFFLTDVITEDIIAYTYQQLERQINMHPTNERKGHWLQIASEEWQIGCPPLLPSKSIFHLLQLGTLNSIAPSANEATISITPLTIAKAERRGYSLNHMRYIMEETTGQQLTSDQQIQFLSWVRQADAYSLYPVTLLAVKQPQQLAAVIDNGNLRQHLHTQLGPRHAVVSPKIYPSLKKWAARHQFFLNTSYEETTHNPASSHNEQPTSYQYLGLYLLTELGKIIPLPYAPPTALLEQIADHISPERKAELNNLAHQVITSLQEAIDGRDAFFPAQQAPTPWLIQQIKQSITEQSSLTILYSALNVLEPKKHTIEPHRLEKRGQLYYLHAYSHRAEANLTLRLDRVVKISNN